MIKYWIKIEDKGNNLSIDNVRLNFCISTHHHITRVYNFLSEKAGKPKTTAKCHQYKHLFHLTYTSVPKTSLTVGLGYNGSFATAKIDEGKGFIEFNPNKLNCKDFWEDLNNILQLADIVSLKRWDLAIDIPAQRNQFCLVRNRKKYDFREYSKNEISETLGIRNHAGFVRLYNKQIEASLQTPFVRLEMTCAENWDAKQILKNLPQVLYFPIDIDPAKKEPNLSNSNIWLLKVLCSHPEKGVHVQDMPRHTKKKLTSFLDAELDVNTDCVNQLLTIVKQWNKGEL